MNVVSLLRFSVSVVLVTGAGQCLLCQDIRLNVGKEDQFATRRIQVFKGTGEKLSGVFKLRDFDQGNQSFVLDDVTGQRFSVPVSDLQRITFEQTLLESNPIAQTAAWRITSKPGKALKYKVPVAALKVDSGDIVFPATAPVAAVSQPTTAANASKAERAQGTTADLVEAKTLTYDSPSKSFMVEVQNIRYTRETFGSSSLSGPKKGLQ